ncbi:hypothetical protein WA026_020997 [Henosepilachna vigintioctopunctata]|uniref:non-specific serine/threonine protein kinase n=1 Tax=Henosepilachna vigintioctopunctata TaxID=420089 RepID=A0AAW1VJ84_9CUCU
MISNNTTYKLKASKSPSEIYSYDQNNSDTSENAAAEGEFTESNSRSQGYLRDNRFRNSSSRGRITEFRPSSWTSERKGFRTRGTPSRNRSERDSSDSYRKYHESSRIADLTGSSYHGKFYEPDKKNDIKLEDTRISKLLRRLSNETDPQNSLIISKKLLDVLLLPDNAPYIRKAFHILGESMFDILQVSPGPMAKKQAARALGRMGYIMAQEGDFERYQNWIFSKMTSSYEDLQILIIETFGETLMLERKVPILQDHVDNLLRNLVTVIETTESAPLFKVMLDVLMNVVEIYPDNFFPLFRDTVDLLFGWHVDHAQPMCNIEYISNNLQRIPKHFQYYIEFSVSLLENFLEDIVNYSKQFIDSGDSTNLEHITVLVLAMNTVLKCLGSSVHLTENKTMKSDFINTLVAQIIKTTSEALESYIPENLTIATNECVGMLLTFLETKSQTLVNTVYHLIDLELSLANEFSDASIVSMLIFISKILKELSANLPVKLIEKLVGPKSELVKLRYSPFANIQDSVICVYQALLNLKNVSLVQEAYRYILGDFEMVYKKILPNFKTFTVNNPFEEVELDNTLEQAETTAIFILRCLSQLANASSIIVMWALKPSILELVAIHLTPQDPYLAQNAPNLQYSLIYLLFSHCRCYNHYISTSSLIAINEENTNLTNLARFSLTDALKDDVTHSSPNSGNFAIILDIIHKTLNTDTGYEVVLLLLKWFKDILNKSEPYLINIHNKKNFVSLTEILVKCGYSLNEELALEVCENLEKLLSNKHLPWSNSFLMNIGDLCKLHMCSNKVNVRNAYSKLASLIPWDVAVVEFNKINSINNSKHQNSTSKDYNSYMISMAQYLHSTGTIYSELCPLQFKKLMNFLLNEKGEYITYTECLEEIFVSSLCLDTESQMNMELFYDLGINSKNVLFNWATLEAAQFCVNAKLRTPLGKPNETFLKIETALNTLGNDLLAANKAKTLDHNKEVTKVRVTLLLQFIEHLEKRIYNAAEGCAIAMPQPTKLVRTFFIANANTCNEWLTRVRMVIIHIALHAAEFNAVIRHGSALMKELASADKVQLADFERCAIFMTTALLNQRETESIYGLYIWCKNMQGKRGRRYSWIKYAAEQSAKKYEAALEGYKQILADASTEAKDEEEDMRRLNVDIRNFIKDQIEVCLKEFHNWSDLLEWRHECSHSLNPEELLRKNNYYWTDWKYIEHLALLDENIHELTSLSDWNIDVEPKSWSCFDTLSTAENNLFQIALKLSFNCMSEDLHEKIELNLNLIESSIQEYLSVTPCELFQYFSLYQYIGNGLKNVYNNIPANTVFLVSENFESEVNMIDSSILRKILWWSEYFGRIQNQGFNSFCSNLRLDIIHRARKEKNYGLAYKHIYRFLKEKDLVIADQDPVTNSLANSIIMKISDITMWTLDTARAVTEVIKVLYMKDEDKHDIFNLCAATSTAISKYTELYGGPELRKVSSNILLKLASWMQNNDFFEKDMTSPLGKLLLVLPEIPLVDSNPSGVIPLNEMAIGKLLQFSVHQCVNLAKGWRLFGTWCYIWGGKILDQGHRLNNNLTEDDCIVIKNLLPEYTTDTELDEILQILSQNRSIKDEEDLDSNSIKTSVMIKNQLQNVKALENADENLLMELLQMWRIAQKRTYNYYNLSAEAYFKYLHLVANSENVSKSTECRTITITLRLLRLIVRYALELQGTLEEGLKATPTQPWKVIIPQLFSRLNHPESYVHHCVSDLLCRVAEDAPHLITFPAVVGALEGGVKFNFSEIKLPKDCLSQVTENNEEDDLNENEDDENDNYESDTEEVTSSLQSSFKVMVDTLSKQDPDTIAQVQLLVRELRRITLLWDELWLGTLLRHHSEINKRQHQLEYEIEKVNENANLSDEEKISLIAEKHRIVIKPLIFVLEQLREVTSVEAETPHEKSFQEKFSAEIDEVIRKLKQPDNPEKPQESLGPLKVLQKKFQQKINKRLSYSLKMQDISPVLANIRDTMIAMPGLTSSKTTVTISHVSNLVSILPTKTKPKKLVFYGSDGQTYTYLFKGFEDLHLDERIMQFLNIANTMMAQNADPTGQNLYRARHYSVIPLGPRSGLINWVDGTTPVFSLYKRWQQREIAKPSTKNSVNTSTAVLRPSELFYNKLNPLLVEHGVKNVENRKEWPLSVLKRVLEELMAETPGDLLAKELWCNSVSAGDWWNVTKRYSYSVAVMSIIGYIIGLGDRHLDNMLVDLTSGEVVHIDYNVCFEKGKTLRVPEKVPFRLTPNIKQALGFTGVEILITQIYCGIFTEHIFDVHS